MIVWLHCKSYHLLDPLEKFYHQKFLHYQERLDLWFQENETMKKTLLTLITSLSFFIITKAQVTFDYTGDVQFYVVQGCVDSVQVDVIGAEGGRGPVGCSSGTSEVGGKGGRVQATIPVTPGDTLFIYVGGKGEDDDLGSAGGGYNGGGDAAADDQYSYYGGGGGGGASDIRLNGTTLSDRVVVAGGGGGAGADGCNCNDLRGGDGGDLTGEPGEGGVVCLCDPSGQGGDQSAGGVKGDWACTCDAQDGSLGQGGMSNTTSCGGPTGGGGGGGGYYGGGGGGLGAGGGGSSYVFSSANNVVHTQGYQTGDGQVVITAYGGMSISVTAEPSDSVCAGTLVTLYGNGADAFFWNNGVTDSVPFVATTTTSYVVTGINANECTDTVHFTLYVYSSSFASLQLGASDTVCTYEIPFELSGGSPGGGAYSGSGVIGSFFYPQNATFDAWNVITYSVTNQGGCISQAKDSIYVATCVGIGLINTAPVKLYPNPSNGFFYVESPEKAEAIVYNMIGDEIMRQEIRPGTNELQLQNYPAGIYSMKFIGDGIRVFRVVKN